MKRLGIINCLFEKKLKAAEKDTQSPLLYIENREKRMFSLLYYQ